MKDKVVYLEESVLALQERTSKGPQQVDEIIHPIRELVTQVTDIKRANLAMANGMNTLHRMMQTPRGLACFLPEGTPTLPYEPNIKDAYPQKKQTDGRKPSDRPEDREDMSILKKPMTKLQKMQYLKRQEAKSSRDTSPGSGV